VLPVRILWSFVTIQQRSHAFSPELNNGNAVPMRSKGILTMGTAFPRVPPRNDHWVLPLQMFCSSTALCFAKAIRILLSLVQFKIS